MVIIVPVIHLISLHRKSPARWRGFLFFYPLSIISVCVRFYDIDLSFRISDLGRWGLDTVVRGSTAQGCPFMSSKRGGNGR